MQCFTNENVFRLNLYSGGRVKHAGTMAAVELFMFQHRGTVDSKFLSCSHRILYLVVHYSLFVSPACYVYVCMCVKVHRHSSIVKKSSGSFTVKRKP